MADLVSDDVPQGTEVRWYAGGVATQIQHTVTGGDVSASGFALGGSYLAEFGSVWIEVNGVKKAVLEFDTSASTPATEDSGCDFVGYTGITEDDVVDIYFVDVAAGILHVAQCDDISDSSSADESTKALHGQPTKLRSVGAVETSIDLNAVMYTSEFVGLVFGDRLAASPNASWEKWSNKSGGFKKIGALIGKRRDSAGAIIEKFFLIGALGNKYDQTFPTEDRYMEKFGFGCDYIQRVRKTA